MTWTGCCRQEPGQNQNHRQGAEPGGCCRTRGAKKNKWLASCSGCTGRASSFPGVRLNSSEPSPWRKGFFHASLAHRLDRQGFLVHLTPNSAGRASRRSIRAAGPWRKGFCQGVEAARTRGRRPPASCPVPWQNHIHLDKDAWTWTRTGCRLPRQRFFKGMLQDADLAGRMQGERAEPPAGRRGHDGRMILRKSTSSAFLPPSRAKFGHTGQDRQKGVPLAHDGSPCPWTDTAAPAGPGRTEIFKVEKIDHFNTPLAGGNIQPKIFP